MWLFLINFSDYKTATSIDKWAKKGSDDHDITKVVS